jgi:hypothetical protein
LITDEVLAVRSSRRKPLARCRISVRTVKLRRVTIWRQLSSYAPRVLLNTAGIVSLMFWKYVEVAALFKI